jgi:hypothetical protein
MMKLAVGMILIPLLTMTANAETAVPSGGKATPQAVAAQTRSPESIECSKQADAKGLHGKPRKTFRSACKKELKKKS